MLLKVGDLARRCGLTVRTLHHYDAIGLLTPSARSDAGYRLYHRGDIARLHQIQALRRFGLSLADIGTILASPGPHLAPIVERQIRLLDEQIAEGRKLRDRLSRLQTQLTRGEEPEMADWLTTLEMMTMYDRYFSAQELQRFPLINGNETSVTAEWGELVKSVQAAMDSALPAESPDAQALAKRWMAMLVRDTNGDPRLLAKLNAMHFQEPAIQAKTGVTPEVMAYVHRAFNETKFAIYAKYLSPDEFRFLRENYGQRGCEWPPLIAAIRQHLEDGTPPEAPEMAQLARQWLELFRAYAGDDPATQARIRAAHEAEPDLRAGTFIDEALLAYVRRAMAGLPPG